CTPAGTGCHAIHKISPPSKSMLVRLELSHFGIFRRSGLFARSAEAAIFVTTRFHAVFALPAIRAEGSPLAGQQGKLGTQ
ncbi:MAG: hypothetical protein KDB22_09715, partial [Planctomycetales bacterium]|nr:hypothetical protein [Planctomycetales bacterium]